VRIIEESQIPTVLEGEIPAHVGIIMDGNGRWALMRGLHRTEGHRNAEPAFLSVIDAALEIGVDWLSVFAFSTENWKRDADEVGFLMSFSEWLLRADTRDKLIQQGVRIKFLGNLADERIPDRSRQWLAQTEQMSGHNSKLHLQIAFNYGGRAEIVDAVNEIVQRDSSRRPVSEEEFPQFLYDPDMPDLDLVIRTSGEERLSNFLLWYASYAEFVFTDTLWPDCRSWHLYSAVHEYQLRQRRKGAPVVEPG
jgi:undecaprenyl diphosphate synthase